MKQKIPFSNYCLIATVAVIVLFAIGLVMTGESLDRFIIFAAVVGVSLFASLFYCPLSVCVTDDAIKVSRPLKTKILPLADIKSVEPFYPSAGGLRLCGSGGFAGYWGYFSDIMCGAYLVITAGATHVFS